MNKVAPVASVQQKLRCGNRSEVLVKVRQGSSVHEDFVTPSVDSINLSQHTFPYPWNQLSMTAAIIAIPHIDTQSRGWTAYSAMMLWALYLIQPQYANTYPLFYFDNVICRDGARNLPQINIWLLSTHVIHRCMRSDRVVLGRIMLHPHHKEVKFRSIFYYHQLRLSPVWSRLEITQSIRTV